ncbi:MAG: polyprenyl synthetase family protein [Candidatus Aminicenantes bacterium]|nr:polyprenyl synthetase family protein [Candidatus Aminicenantes bacterium]
MILKDIQSPVQKLLNDTTSVLSATLNSDVNLINQIKAVVPVSKGKKIRSTLLFLLSGANNNYSDKLLNIASSIELFHLSSLIHDDILDSADQRRGEKTLNNSMGNMISVLGGDFLFVHSLNIMNNIKNPRLLDILLDSTRIMVEGQLQEIENNFNYDVSLETYLEVISKKTSSLFGAVTRMAAIISGEETKIENEFYEFGINFGNIFQISDDLIDIFSTSSGKDRFRDLQEGKITLPFILLQNSSAKEDVKKYFSVEHSKKLLDLFERYNIKEKSQEKVDEYYKKCQNFLERFSPSPYKESLTKILDFIRFREY